MALVVFTPPQWGDVIRNFVTRLIRDEHDTPYTGKQEKKKEKRS